MADIAGVWVSHSWDIGATDVRPHASEIEALRWVNAHGYGSAMFLPFGETVEEVDRARRLDSRNGC